MRQNADRTLIFKWSTGFGAILLGIMANLLGIVVLDGFASGVVMGVGIVLTLSGVVMLAGTLGWLASKNRASGADGWWLPSRDDDR